MEQLNKSIDRAAQFCIILFNGNGRPATIKWANTALARTIPTGVYNMNHEKIITDNVASHTKYIFNKYGISPAYRYSHRGNQVKIDVGLCKGMDEYIEALPWLTEKLAQTIESLYWYSVEVIGNTIIITIKETPQT